jgi:hypothetical protein
MIRRSSILLIILVLAFAGNVFAQKVQMTGGEDSLYSAKRIEQEEQLNHAIDEYRLMDLTSPGKVELRLNLLDLCSKARRYSDGVNYYENWGYHPTNVPTELRRKYVGLYFLTHDFEGMRKKLGEDIVVKEPERTQIALHLALYDRQWSVAKNLYQRFEVQHVYKTKEAYKPVMAAVERLRYHPVLVGGLLSLIPGGGLAYNKRPGPAVAMLALVGASSMATWNFARQGERGVVPAKIFGVVTASLFVVNIGAGAFSSKRYNENLDKQFQQNMDWFTARQF